MTDELKSLIEDAAKLLGYKQFGTCSPTDGLRHHVDNGIGRYTDIFNPLNPERGDLMKVAEAAGVSIRFGNSEVTIAEEDGGYKTYKFTKGDYQFLALAILRAASAVLHSRGGV